MPWRTNNPKAREVIEQSMDALGLRMDMKTDPEVIRILLKEMRLDDFRTKFLPMQKFFGDAVTRPQPLRSMFESIVHGIVHKHPAIVEFAELALSKKWFSPSPHILRSVHVTFILEAMTAAMCNSTQYFLELHDHLQSKEILCGADSSRPVKAFMAGLSITHSVFCTMKAISIDAFMTLFRKKYRCVKEARNFIERKLLSPLDHHLEHTVEWVRINIYEAAVTEYKKGYKANALCAFALNEDLKVCPPDARVKKTTVVPDGPLESLYSSLSGHDNHFPVIPCSQNWVSLYVTWNMAFAVSDVDNWDIVLPKLFIPSIINSKPANFLGVRFISLWLALNNTMFRMCSGRPSVPTPSYRREMAMAWGKINERYVSSLLRMEIHEPPKIFSLGFRRFFRFPVLNFLKIFEHFLAH
ncbi:MAG: hypothetical protein PHZ00_04180 [Candidatus Peribacteraceae bacterium]|nr:hypothetical protein [Candidatus Peribacteraceae bacterium]